MNKTFRAVLPHAPISFRTIYWLFFISLALVVWASLLYHFGQNLEAREAMDSANWHVWIAQRLTLKALLFRQGNWVVEELIFRGLLLQVLRRYCPLWLALLVSAVLFSLIHLSKGPSTMTVAFVMSYYFAWLMIRTNSIYAPIVAHWALDFSGLYVIFPLLAASGRINAAGFSFPLWAWVLSAAVIVTGIFVLRREFRTALTSRPSTVLILMRA
jgi:membrane protease YdiL (CAAX protease family)